MRAALRTTATAEANLELGGGNFCLRLSVADWPGSRPGQFAMLSAGALGSVSRDDPLLPRPMAIYRTEARADGRTLVDIAYKVVGRGTGLLRDVVPGDRLRLVAPLGKAFAAPEVGRDLVLVGGGTGIASLYDLAAQCAESHSVRVLLGARGASDLLGRSDFEKLPVDLELATEDGSAGERGRVTELLAPRLRGEALPQVYACGPTPMMRAVAEACAERGAACVVSLENHMACGVGICLGCAVPAAEPGAGFHLVCRDGPVFAASDVSWDGLP